MTNTPTNPEATTDPPPEATMNPEGFRSSPGGHVYGIVNNPQIDVPGVTADLLAAHLPLDGIHIYCCSEGVDALDLAGTGHGLRARITRFVQSIGYADIDLKRIESELEAGHALIGVAVDDERKHDVAQILQRHGGHDLVYFGDFTWQRLGSQGSASAPKD